MNEYRNHPQQRKALHKWLELCAQKAASSGLTMQVILKETPEVQPTGEMFKKCIYKPILQSQTSLESTEDQKTTDPEVVRREMIVFFAEKFGLELPPWPDRNYGANG